MNSGEMREIKGNKGFIPKENDLIESPIKQQEEDDWNQYSDDEHDFNLAPEENENKNNSINYEANKISFSNNNRTYDNSNVNKSGSYKVQYKKGYNERKFNGNHDYQDKQPYYGKSNFSGKNYEKGGYKQDKYYNRDNNNKQYNYDEGKKNYYKENNQVSNVNNNNHQWKRGDSVKNENWDDEYQNTKSFSENFDKNNSRYENDKYNDINKNYSEQYDYRKKYNNNYNKSSGFKQNNNYNEPNYNVEYNDNITNNNKYYYKNAKGHQSYKNFKFTEKHFTSNDYPEDKQQSNSKVKFRESQLDKNVNNFKQSNIEIIPCGNSEPLIEQKNHTKNPSQSNILFSEKKTFINTNLVNTQNSSESSIPSNISNNNTNTNTNTSNSTKNPSNNNQILSITSNNNFKVKSTPPQNKFNNPEVNVSPLINRNLIVNNNVQNLPSLEESGREKALNLNSASYIPNKWKDKVAESNFNKYDMHQSSQQNFYPDNHNINNQYNVYPNYTQQQTSYYPSTTTMTSNIGQNPMITQSHQYQYNVNPNLMQQPMMYQPMVQPCVTYPSQMMHQMPSQPNVYFNNFGLLNK